jgi:hypothetical protein
MQQLDYFNGWNVFSMWSVPRGYKREEVCSITRVEAGSNTSTVTLRVVEEGDDKGVSNLR